MFQYEYEKRPPSSNSCDSRATVSTDWSRRVGVPDRGPRRPLPPRPGSDRMPAKTAVPLKIWLIASASCFAVCAALVLAMVVIIKWGEVEQYPREVYAEPPEPYYNPNKQTNDVEPDIPVLEKLSMFKNIVAKDRNRSLLSKHQMHPIHEDMHHEERRIEKKDKAKAADVFDEEKHRVFNNEKVEVKHEEFKLQDGERDVNKIKFEDLDENIVKDKIKNGDLDEKIDKINFIPEFKPIDVNQNVKLPPTFVKYKDQDFQEYYDDINLYDDYIQSNSLTNYLLEKVQELHDWIVKDPDLVTKNETSSSDFGGILRALNSSLVEGNASIIMDKLRDVYFGGIRNASGESIINNKTDLVTFGILSLDVMLLHNIQMMAWESQETARIKMLRDPDVYAFNALFLDPSKLDVMQNEIQTSIENNGPHNRQNKIPEEDFGKNLLSNILDVGMSTARAAIHLGRAYKNTRTLLTQLSNKETQNKPRYIDGSTHVLNRLQASFGRNNSVASSDGEFYTELDCVWLLYCRNLVATSKLNPPYGTMARINGVALRMMAGELSADRAIDTILYEAFTGWTELKCNDMFSKCSKVNAAAVVMDKIIQPLKKHNHSSG